METRLSKRKDEPWICRALDWWHVCLVFCQAYGVVLRHTKDEPWILWTYKDQQAQSLGLMSLVCIVSVVLLYTWHLPWVACTRDVMACSCIHASYRVARTRGMVARISGTHQGPTLGFASPLKYEPTNFLIWVLGTVLLHTCHSS